MSNNLERPFSSLELDSIAEWPVYKWSSAEKKLNFAPFLDRLTEWHKQQCNAYEKLHRVFIPYSSFSSEPIGHFALPVRLFKTQRLQSVSDEQVVKTMLSSGTGGLQSTIVLDKYTAALQTKILSKIMTELIGKHRLPMLILDCPSTVKNRFKFSARTAAIHGFSMYGRHITFAFDDEMNINWDAIEEFAENFASGPVLLFGFTYLVWLHWVLALENSKRIVNFPQGILLHGGGWKKLEHKSVSKVEFKTRLNAVNGLSRVHNYYGMVEQTGSIFMECEFGHLHCPAWADIRIRHSLTHKIMNPGALGLIELSSLIPQSYPGHVILTEDIGRVIGEDDCQCHRKGKYFEVIGRITNAEVRGCSDSYSI